MIRLYLQSRYRRLYRQVQHLLRSGRFARLTRRRRDQLVQRLRRYEVRLSRMGMAAMTTAALFAGGVELEGQVQPVGAEFRIGESNLPVSPPAVAMDDDGDYAIAYISINPANFEYALFVQRYDNTGSEVGDAIIVYEGELDYGVGSRCEIAMDDDGDFVVAWQEDGLFPFNYVRAYTSDGMPVTDPISVNAVGTSAYLQPPSVAMDADGDFVVAYATESAFSYDMGGVYVHRFNSDGTANGTPVVVHDGYRVYELYCRVSMDDDGDFAVAYQPYIDDIGTSELLVKRYDIAGTEVGTAIQIAMDPPSGLISGYFDIDHDDDGNFVTSYIEGVDDTYSLYLRRYDATSDVLSGANLVTSGADVLGFPYLSVDGDGDIGITWTAGQYDTYNYNAYYQAYDAVGNAIFDQVAVTSSITQIQGLSRIASDDQGNTTIVWIELDDPAVYYAAYGQRYVVPTTSVFSPPETGSLTLYPNPATDRLYLRDAQPGRVAVYDMLGRMTHQATLVGSQNSIDVSTLRSGQYVLVHTDEQGQVSRARFQVE